MSGPQPDGTQAMGGMASFDPVTAMAARRLTGARTIPEWVACLGALERQIAFVKAKVEKARKVRIFVGIGLVVATILAFVFGGPLPGIAMVVITIVGVIVLVKTSPTLPALKDPAPLAELLRQIGRELAPDLQVSIEADLARGDDAAKAAPTPPVVTKSDRAGRKDFTVTTADFHDPWLSAALSPAKGVTIVWQQSDAYRRRIMNWRNARNKGKSKVRYASRSLLAVRLAVPRARYEPVARVTQRHPYRLDIRDAGKTLKVSVKQFAKAKSTEPEPGDTSAIAALIKVACDHVRPLPEGGKSR